MRRFWWWAFNLSAIASLGLVIVAAILAVWGHGTGGIFAGCILYMTAGHRAGFYWMPGSYHGNMRALPHLLHVNFWKALPMLAILPIVRLAVWNNERNRPPPGHCQRCGYNLTGNVSGICPECGAALAK